MPTYTVAPPLLVLYHVRSEVSGFDSRRLRLFPYVSIGRRILPTSCSARANKSGNICNEKKNFRLVRQWDFLASLRTMNVF